MTKQIQLTQGKVALVDDEDYALVSCHRWYAHKYPGGADLWYARRALHKPTRGATQTMHRLLMGFRSGMEIDHANHNGLDNRRCNLRWCTKAENARNARKWSSSACHYKGIRVMGNGWQARIRIDGELVHLGSFDTAAAAANAYNRAAAAHWGIFACLNDIPEEA